LEGSVGSMGRLLDHHPFETWPATGRKGLAWGLAALALVVSAALLLIGTQLREGGLVALELARSHERVAEILASWEARGALGLGAFGLGLDMLYLVAYGLLLSFAAAVIAASARARGATTLATAGVFAAWMALVAAALDVFENAFQVPYFADPTAGVPGAVASFAALKFMLLGYVIAVSVAGAILNRRARPLSAA